MLGGAIVLFGVLAAAAVPFLVPVDRYRTLLEGYIRSAAGRDVQIAALRLELWPRPQLRARDVRLLNPPGFPPGAAVEAQTVVLGVDLRALLDRRLEIRRIALSDVRINVLTDVAGRSNLNFPATPGRRPAIAGGVLTLTPIGAVAIKNVNLSAGTYDATRRRTTTSFGLAGLSAVSRSVEASAPMERITATVDLKGARLTVPSLTAPVQVTSGTLILANAGVKATFAAVVDTMKITGTTQVPRLYAPVISFALAGNQLDVARLQRLLTAQAPEGPPAHGGASAPRRLVASGTLAFDRFALGPFTASGARARIGVYTDLVRLDTYSLTAYGGTITGAATLEPALKGAPASFTVHARGVDAARLLRALAGGSQVSGALETDGVLRTMLAADPWPALTGAGTFAIRNGSFTGLDIRKGTAQVAKLVQPNIPGGPTRFSYFGGDARIAREHMFSSALRLLGDNLQATGSGVIGFDGTLNYRGTAVTALPAQTVLPAGATGLLGNYLSGTAGGRTVSVPFTLTGSVAQPHFAVAGIPQFLAGTPASPAPPPAAPPSPQIPGLPSFLQNLPKIP
jgi:AsmA-like C-terminal region/AsmA family